ncbi:MAG: rhomboid family intramembrane serine protease, partial [Candidatus Muiribacteriaceae bacterium]
RMNILEYSDPAGNIFIDNCPDCGGFWFDRGELASLRRSFEKNLKKGRVFKRPVHLAEESDVLEHYHSFDASAEAAHADAGAAIYIVSLIFGVPFELYNPRRYFPHFLTLLVFLNVLIFSYSAGLQIEELSEFYHRWGMIPVEFVSNPFSLISYSFIHGGVMHVLPNMYFLWVFGDNVYDIFRARGVWKGLAWFVFYYVVVSVLAGLFHAFVAIFSGTILTSPLIGASGVTSAILGSYMRLFPKSVIYQVFLFIPIRLRASRYIILWFLLNIFMAVTEFTACEISWQAHIGGFIAGYVLIDRFISVRPEEIEIDIVEGQNRPS